MSRKNVFITIGVVLLGAAVVGANLYFKKDKGLSVTTDVIKSRDLEAIVSASGKVQPKRLVKISAETSGRVVDLAVNEGDRIKKGQFLLQIDPKSLRSRVESGSASLRAAEQSLDQMRQAIETAKVQLQQAQQNLTRQRNLWAQQLTTREALDKAENDLKSAESAVQERQKQMNPQESRIAQERAQVESARYDLSKVRIESTIDGIVTRRNVQEGETAVIGTMNNEPIPDVRPGFTCTADITTATRKEVISVPIPAVAVRELVFDANGQVVKEPRNDKRRRSPVETVAAASELKPGQTRKEVEGVFVVRDGRAEFLPIKMGIAGDKYFEVLSGLKTGDQVITGPYNSVRGMADGNPVKIDNAKKP